MSPSELGYRAQAILAETLARMGAIINDVARTGHPDLTAQIRGRLLGLQVKATRDQSFTLAAEDLAAIRPRFSQEEGFLAVLDLAPPLAWSCINYARLGMLVARTVPLAMLKSMQDASFSSECTDNCVQLLIQHRDSPEAFTFSLARKRALREERSN